MGQQIIRVGRTEDLYVVWSSITECPTGWGTRAEVEEGLLTDWAGRTGGRDVAIVVRGALERADKAGSSARGLGMLWGRCIIYQQQGWMTRAALRELIRRAELAGPDPTSGGYDLDAVDIRDQLRPFEEPEDAPRGGDGDPLDVDVVRYSPEDGGLDRG